MKIKLLIFLIAAVKLSLKGEAHVQWETSESRRDSKGKLTPHTKTFHANEIYFKTTSYILGGMEGKKKLNKI